MSDALRLFSEEKAKSMLVNTYTIKVIDLLTKLTSMIARFRYQTEIGPRKVRFI